MNTTRRVATRTYARAKAILGLQNVEAALILSAVSLILRTVGVLRKGSTQPFQTADGSLGAPASGPAKSTARECVRTPSRSSIQISIMSA
jgi:hypothetical protein